MIQQKPLPPDIIPRLASLSRALERCPSLVFAYLFGGAARGELRPLSDVDLVILNAAPTSLVGRILASRRVILDRDPFRRHRFESLALRKFLDFRILEHRLLAERYPGA